VFAAQADVLSLNPIVVAPSGIDTDHFLVDLAIAHATINIPALPPPPQHSVGKWHATKLSSKILSTDVRLYMELTHPAVMHSVLQSLNTILPHTSACPAQARDKLDDIHAIVSTQFTDSLQYAKERMFTPAAAIRKSYPNRQTTKKRKTVLIAKHRWRELHRALHTITDSCSSPHLDTLVAALANTLTACYIQYNQPELDSDTTPLALPPCWKPRACF
jgi:hypothetical protein